MAEYYVDVTNGNNGNTGLSEAQAWADLSYAADQVAAGDTVNVEATASYTAQDGANDCVLHITTAGTLASPIVWQGYKTNPDDGGIVTIDADTNTLANAVKTAISGNVYNVFKNFEFKGGSGAGFNAISSNDDNVYCKNCRFTDNDGHGFTGDNSCRFINCSFDNNGSDGIDHDNDLWVIGGLFYTNTSNGFFTKTGYVIFALGYNNGNTGVFVLDDGGAAINCTADGEGGASSKGIDNPSSGRIMVVNTIIHDTATGIDGFVTGESNFGRNNLFNSNTANVSEFLTPNTDQVGSEPGESEDDVTATPGFTDEANDDYTLSGSGSADANGFDAKFVDDFWDSYIGGTNPPSP